ELLTSARPGASSEPHRSPVLLDGGAHLPRTGRLVRAGRGRRPARPPRGRWRATLRGLRLALHHLETHDGNAHTATLVVLVRTLGPSLGPLLVVLAPFPPRDDEVPLLPCHGPQQLESQEAGKGVHSPLPRREPLLDLGLCPAREGERSDVDESHEILLGHYGTDIGRLSLAYVTR